MTEPIRDFRELYRLISDLKTDILSKVDKLENQVDMRLTRMETSVDARMAAHELTHTRDKDYRSQLTRWAVTSLLSASAVGVALVLGIMNII